MYAANPAKLSLITFFLLIFSLFLVVQGAPVAEKNSKKNNIIYTRYVRRRPSEYLNDLYVDDFVEVFRVRQKPTPSYLLSDDEVDRIIRCDFDPQLKECEDLPKLPTVRPEIVTSESISTSLITTTLSYERIPSTSATTAVPLASSTTTTTTTAKTPLYTTTEDLPFLPDIPASAEEITATTIDRDVEILESTTDTNEFTENHEDEDAYVDDYDDDDEDTYDQA